MKQFNELSSLIGTTQTYFKQQAQKQVNVALTLRNWMFGFYISEYELNGENRAEYREKLFKEIEKQLKLQGVENIRERHLYLCRKFYQTYPNILQTATAKLYLPENEYDVILRSLSAKSEEGNYLGEENILRTPSAELQNIGNQIDINKIINQLSFSHFIEFLKLDTSTKRNFYENEAIKNNWSVRELQRAMNSMLFERTGLSKNKPQVSENNNQELLPENFFRSPYILEFLGLKQETEYSENQLETAIISHLQSFLLELGKGFCFEARQKRITFDNTHYYIDLVFYHRFLRCNILIDLKLGEFSHADAGQMNVYLNYYNENELQEGDNPPIGIILCANKNESLVKYATTGLSQQIFVNKYMINLPNEEELKKIIEEEQSKF